MKSEKFGLLILFVLTWSLLYGCAADDPLAPATGRANVISPLRIGSATNWTKVALGLKHTMAINSVNELYVWGDNSGAQIGNGESNFNVDVTSPLKIGTADDWSIIAAGGLHSLAINSSGELYTWGYDAYGELGNGDSDTNNVVFTPAKIGVATNWTAIAAGYYHSVALNGAGELYAWGDDSYGQVGNGAGTNVTAPAKIGVATNWTAIAAGYYFTVALNSAGELYVWGRDDSGQVGNGDDAGANVTTPTKIGVATNWTKIATGSMHTLALNSSGELYAWGSNIYGQQGNGLSDSVSVTAPTKLGTETNWSIIGGGSATSFAINSAGELYAWGSDHYGQIGNGNSNICSTILEPERIGTASDWTAIDGGYHSVGINSSGELYLWGRNGDGEIGNGN